MAYEIDGYKCWEEYEVEWDGDNAKIWHWIRTPDGETETMHHTPYESLDRMDWMRYVRFHQKFGYFPERREWVSEYGRLISGNWDIEHLGLLDLEIRG